MSRSFSSSLPHPDTESPWIRSRALSICAASTSEGGAHGAAKGKEWPTIGESVPIDKAALQTRGGGKELVASTLDQMGPPRPEKFDSKETVKCCALCR